MADLVGEVASGDRRRSLVALRDTLAMSIASADPEKVAPLAKQLRDVLAEIETLGAGEVKSARDDLAAKRKARRSTAKAG